MSQSHEEMIPTVQPSDGMVAAPPIQLAVGEMLVPHRNRAALTAYYLAIFSLIPGVALVLGPFAFVLGIQGLCQSTVDPRVRGGYHAMFSIALALVTTVVNWSALVTVGMIWFVATAPA